MSELNKTSKTIDACRFCWMCRHVCPVGNQTGKEVNTPRGRAMVLSSVLEGKEIDEEIADVIYECSLCGGCIEQCVTGYDPTTFTRAARAEVAAEDKIPSAVRKVVNRLLETNNLYGLSGDKRKSGYAEMIKDLPEKADVVLYIGCSAAYQQTETAQAAIKLLKKAGVNFTVLKEEECCGLYLYDLLGLVEEVRQQAMRVKKKILETDAKLLIPICPSCSKTFIQHYKEWGIDLGIKVQTFTSYLEGLVSSGQLKPRKYMDKVVTIHDPCRLARDLEETAPVRKLLQSMGIEVREMFFNGAKTHCCGGELLQQYNTKITEKTASARWQEAKQTEASSLVVACPSCKTVMEKKKPLGMDLDCLITLLWEQCK